jgi:hypothetical protein
MKRIERKDARALVPVNGGNHRQHKGGAPKGHKRYGGRQKGTPNKYNQYMRDAILAAAAKVGSDGRGKDGVDGYLERCARTDCMEYLKAMVKLVPHKLHAIIDHTITLENVHYETVEEAREALEREGVIIDQILQ